MEIVIHVEMEFYSFCHTNHFTCVHYFKSVLPFSATKQPNLVCRSSMHGCHVCLLQPLAFSSLLLNDLVESAGSLHSHLLFYVYMSLS